MADVPKPAFTAAATQSTEESPAPPELLAMLGHELRNPLAAIRNSAAVLVSLCSDPRQTQAVDIISRNAVHMTRMLDDLLDAARLRRGAFALRKQRVDIAVIIHEVLDDIRPVLEARHQNLHLALPADPVLMECDPTRLAQILTNLLKNANQYTGDGGSIAVAATVSGNELTIEVADNGAGIDKELLPKLFNVFAQAPQPLDRSQGGLGLGLVIARNLAEMHGGSLTAESPGLGQGSRFLLRLPIDSEPLATQNETIRAKPKAAPVVQARRVLIIEDHEDIALSFSLALSELGYISIRARTGEQGLVVAEQFIPEVVLLDIGLPGMNGFEVARRLREIPVLAQVLIIALSGYSPGLFRESTHAVFDHYLVKPVAPDTVLSIIAESLPSKSAGEA